MLPEIRIQSDLEFVQASQQNNKPPNELEKAFQISFAQGCFEILKSENSLLLHSSPPIYSFIFSFTSRFVQHVLQFPITHERQIFSDQEFIEIAQTIPPLEGLEHHTSIDVLKKLYKNLESFLEDINKQTPIAQFLQSINPAFHYIGKTCFHLAQNKSNQMEKPFVFLITHVSQVSKESLRPQHIPLHSLLGENQPPFEKSLLLKSLKVMHAASEKSTFLKNLMTSHKIYGPQFLNLKETQLFLQEIEILKETGILIKTPDWWKNNRPPNVKVEVKFKESQLATKLTGGKLLDFSVCPTIEGEALTQEELAALLSAVEPLTLFRGKFIEVDQMKINSLLEHWQKLQKLSEVNGLTVSDALRTMFYKNSDTHESHKFNKEVTFSAEWGSQFDAFLNSSLQKNVPEKFEKELKQLKGFNAILRPYQISGVSWLVQMVEWGLGACLADDMGLGKTLQIICLMKILKKRSQNKHKTLLVVPASLMNNWKSEIQKFTTDLKCSLIHGISADEDNDNDSDCHITTYGYLTRKLEQFKNNNYDLIVADEAQALKNANTQQTKAIKSLKCKVSIALTGTPVENRLMDLWSIFDFINPGLLGTESEFFHFSKERNNLPSLRKLIQPYLLRRLKTDKNIIQDLPEKIEYLTQCGLSQTQISLYQHYVKELEISLQKTENAETKEIERKGIVLSYILRFKQICNHPGMLSDISDYTPQHSGKFLKLKELCDDIIVRGEKVLIFTQFQELTLAIHRYLESIYGKESGLLLNGQTPIPQRKKLVEKFSEKNGPQFFVISLKAGGTGLNLVQASHVIHFDRWWNPAVENQATDRAFRIGQKRNVLVHKFICAGTIEDKINSMLEDKKSLSDEVLQSEGVNLLLSMDNQSLINTLKLNLSQVIDSQSAN